MTNDKARAVAEVESLKRRLLAALPSKGADAILLLAALTGFSRAVLMTISAASGKPYDEVAQAFTRRITQTNNRGDEHE